MLRLWFGHSRCDRCSSGLLGVKVAAEINWKESGLFWVTSLPLGHPSAATLKMGAVRRFTFRYGSA